MSNTVYAGNSFRPHWAGEASNDDVHLEVFERDVQTTLEHRSLFLSEKLSSYKPLSNSNTYRGDRLSGRFEVKGRSSGERPESTKVLSEKLIVRADTLSYTRIPIDFQDDWTAPNYRKELAANAGTAHAKSSDVAHVIQLEKALSWEAPPSLADTFAPLTERVVELNPDDSDSAEEYADAWVSEIKDAVNRFLLEKDIPCDELTLLVDPAVFSVLMEHKKLLNVRYSHSAGSDYAMRRVAFVAGVRIIECNSFPQEAIEEHPLGVDFFVTAEEAQTKAILFHAGAALVTVEAKAMTSKEWEDERELTHVLDSYRMYTVGLRRPDLVIGFREVTA